MHGLNESVLAHLNAIICHQIQGRSFVRCMEQTVMHTFVTARVCIITQEML